MNTFLTVYLVMMSITLLANGLVVVVGERKARIQAALILSVGIPMGLWAASLRGIW